MRFLLARATVIAGVIFLTGVGQAQAQESAVDRARALGQQAGAAFAQGHWEEARSLYHQALDLYPAPTLGVREARCLVKLGRLVEAKAVYEHVAALPIDATKADVTTLKRAKADATQELTDLNQRLPHLTVSAESGTRVALTLDGVAITGGAVAADHEVDPGPHTIAGTIDDHPIDPVQVTLGEGEHRTVTAKPAAAAAATPVAPTAQELPPADTAPPSDVGPAPRSGMPVQRILGFTAMGVGLVGLGVGIGLGAAAGDKHSDLDSACPNGVCAPSQQSTLDSFHSLRVGSTVGYVVGGVFLAGGLVLVITAPKKKSQTAPPATGVIEPMIGLGTLGMRGAF